ncbi:MAG: hypothetical protein PHX51_03610 [Clostridia bacterium]|nr:hypothetical protein [Clostridia bacterium]
MNNEFKKYVDSIKLGKDFKLKLQRKLAQTSGTAERQPRRFIGKAIAISFAVVLIAALIGIFFPSTTTSQITWVQASDSNSATLNSMGYTSKLSQFGNITYSVIAFSRDNPVAWIETYEIVGDESSTITVKAFENKDNDEYKRANSHYFETTKVINGCTVEYSLSRSGNCVLLNSRHIQDGLTVFITINSTSIEDVFIYLNIIVTGEV